MSQQLFKNLLHRMDEHFSLDRKSMLTVDWLNANTTLDRKAFTTDRYPFQTRILNDMHPNLCVIKPSQVGLTEGQIRKALAFLVRNSGLSLIYTLPNEDMYTRISDTRVRPILRADKVFNPPTTSKPIRRKDLMELGRSKLYVVAAIESSATSIDADAVFIDETDLSDQKMLALLNSRMQNSDWRIKQQFSTPTYPMYGIHQNYELSDKHVFFRKCSACGHYNNPEFSRKFLHYEGLPSSIENLSEIDASHLSKIDFKTSYVMCEKCNSPLDLDNYDLAEWVATYPSITSIRGYAVTPFSTNRLTPEYIVGQLIQYKSKEFLRGFYNTTLGLPYSDGTMQISHESISLAFEGASPISPEIGQAPVWAGIDVGQVCNIVLGTGSNKHDMEPFSFRIVPIRNLVSELEEIMRTYKLVGGLIDRQPYTPKAEEIFSLTNEKIVPAQYGITNGLKLDDFSKIEYYKLDRTGSLDFVHTRLKRRDVKFMGYGNYESIIKLHLRDMVREEINESTVRWKKLTNKDHFFHALGYLFAAPEACELIDMKISRDNRCVVFLSEDSPDKEKFADNLIGFGGGKTVDKILSRRVLN